MRCSGPAAGAAGDCAGTGEPLRTRARITTTAMITPRFMHSSSERRPDRELDGAEILALATVDVDAVVHADRPERRLPADTGTDRLPQVGQVEFRLEPIHVADVEEPGQPQIERERHDVFHVAQHLGGATDPDPRVVDRGDLPGLEAPDGVGATEVEALEDRQLLTPGQAILHPAEAVPGLGVSGQDMSVPHRVEV